MRRSLYLLLLVVFSTVSTFGQYTTSLSLGFDVYGFTDCGDGQTCSTSNQSGEVKMYLDRILDNTAYFRIIKCGTTAEPVNTLSFGFPEGEIIGSFYILKNSPCGTIVTSTVTRKGDWFYELEVPLSPNQLATDYYGVYFPNNNYYGAGIRHVTGAITITGYLPAPTLNAPILVSPTAEELTAFGGGILLQWNKNSNPSGTNYQIYVFDQTTNTVLKNYESANDVSQKSLALGFSNGNYIRWSVRAVKDGYVSAESNTQNFYFNNSALTINPSNISASTGSTSTNFTFNATVNNIVKSPYPAPTVNIEFTRPDGSNFTQTNITQGTGLNFSHTQSFTQAGIYQYRFVANQLNRTPATTTSASFTVTGVTIANPIVSSPSTGANLTAGQMTSLQWSFPNYTSPISIELTSGSTSTTPYLVLYNPTNNDGIEVWQIPSNLPTGQYRIKIYNTGAGQNGNPTYVGYSGVFNVVVPPTVTVTNPVASANLSTGQSYPINWTFSNFSGNVSIELTAGTSGTTPYLVLFDPTTNDGIESWQIPSNVPAGQYRIKIYNTGAGQGGNPTYVGYSGVFNIVAGAATPKKVIGYLPAYQWGANFNSAYLDRFTHINLSFISPVLANATTFQTDAQGDYIWGLSNGKTVADAKTKIALWLNNGFKGDYFFSIGGAEASTTQLTAFRTALNSTTNRTKMLNGLNKFLANFDVTHKIKGIDVDLEYTAMNISGYNTFVQVLADDLHTKNMQISVATEYKYPAGVYIQNDDGSTVQKVLGTMIDNTSLSKIDWLNMMSYDYVQASDLSGNTLGLNHSPYTLAQRDFAYWNTTRSLPTSKIVLGLPIYGRESGGAAGEIAYRDLKCKEVPAWYNPDFALRDNDIATTKYCYYGTGYQQKPSNITVYQNGRTTLQEKYDYANTSQMAGVMFWAMGNDIWEDENQTLLGFLPKNCPQSKVMNYTYNSGNVLTEKAVNINSMGLINTGAKISLQAEKSITITQSFQAQSGSVFVAGIKGCSEN